MTELVFFPRKKLVVTQSPFSLVHTARDLLMATSDARALKREEDENSVSSSFSLVYDHLPSFFFSPIMYADRPW